jgi:hypothetical protein
MAHSVSDGIALAQTTGQKVRDGVGAAATGIRGEMEHVAHGIREEIDGLRHHESAAHKREQHAHRERSGWPARMVKLAASAAGAMAAFFVSRLVRSRHGRPER